MFFFLSFATCGTTRSPNETRNPDGAPPRDPSGMCQRQKSSGSFHLEFCKDASLFPVLHALARFFFSFFAHVSDELAPMISAVRFAFALSRGINATARCRSRKTIFFHGAIVHALINGQEIVDIRRMRFILIAAVLWLARSSRIPRSVRFGHRALIDSISAVIRDNAN